MSSIEQDIALLEASGLMQGPWYLRQYPDAAQAAGGAAEHYLQTGAGLLHDPGPGFSTRRYLRANPDVAAAGMNPLLHYLRHGRKEGRACFPVGDYTAADDPPEIEARDPRGVKRDAEAIGRTRLFDPDYYLATYPDIAAAGIDPLLHYVEHGASEGRLPNAYFDTRFYRGEHQDADDRTNPLAHYATTPGSDTCRTSAQFDGRFYAARYADAREAGMKPLEHFLTRGIIEGRQAEFPTPAQVAVPRIVDCRTIRTTVIVPVHDACDETRSCIESLLRHTELGGVDNLLVIDDASSDAGTRELLAGIADLPGVTVVINPSNLGYTRTVNKGCGLAGSDDVVLLNSDTVVGPHWLRNLKIAAHGHDRIGTVTAVSDNAGAFSVPDPGRNAIPDGVDVDMLARAAMDAGVVAPIEVPTGSGFCLYVKRGLIDTIGLFDETTFPEGYGEENDFCMRALAAGWYNTVDPRTWVHHVRSASFGDRRKALAEVGTQRVAALHPNYAGAIGAIASSPSFAVARYRIAKQFRLLATGQRRPKPRVMYVISTRIGGVPQANRDLMLALADACECYALCCDRNMIELLRATDAGYEVVERYRLSDPIAFATHTSREYDDITRFILFRHGIDLLHVRHLAWHGLNLVDVARGLGIPAIASFHDYYAVCPTVNLLDEEGAYHPGGVAENASNPLWHTDPTATAMTPGYLRMWQRRMQDALADCDGFVASSDSARRIVSGALPDIAARADDFYVIPHGRDFDGFRQCVDSAEIAAGAPLRILLPGNIGRHKGRELVRRIKQLDVDARLEFHLLGTTDADLGDAVIDHGPYQREQFAERAAAIRPHVAAVLSTCPETWCHTLTESWACGLPVFAIDMGAVGERIREHGGGWLVEREASPAAIQARLLEIRDSASERQDRIEEALRWQQGEGRLENTGRMAERYRTLYQAVIQRHRVRGP